MVGKQFMAISCLLLKQISSERRPLFCQPLYAIWRNCPNSMILMDQKESAEENKEASTCIDSIPVFRLFSFSSNSRRLSA